MYQAGFGEETFQKQQGKIALSEARRRRAARASLLVYAWVASCVLLSLAIAAWLSRKAVFGNFVTADLWFAIIALVLLWIGLRALCLQLEDVPGVMLVKEDSPVLFEVLDRLRDKLGGPRIDRVLLDTQFNISIRRQPRFGRYGGKINCLSMGLPTLLALDRRRLFALLAQEYGRFHGGRGPLALWIYQNMPQRVRSLLPERSLADARAEQVKADQISRRLLGRHVAAAALIEFTIKEDWVRRQFWSAHWRAAAASLMPLPPFAAMRVLAATPPPDEFARESLRRALARPRDPKHALSLLGDRLEALRASPHVPAWSSSPAIKILGERGEDWLAEFDRQWCGDNADEWKLHRAYLSRLRERGQYLAERFRKSSADELIEVAELMRRLDVEADSRSVYERVLQLAPGHPGALKGLVQCLPESDWQRRVACASMLFNISESSRGWASRAAVATLEKHAGDSDDDEAELQYWRVRRDESEGLEHRAQIELARSSCFDAIAPNDLGESDKGELLSRLARCTSVVSAWLVRKRLKDMASRRCYIVFLEMQGLDEDRRYLLCRELEASLELPGLTLVLSAGRALSLPEIRRQAFEPIYVRQS